jgi:hypothetical protein
MTPASSQHSDAPRRDTPAATSTVHWQRAVPKAIRCIGALPDADYADIVTATIAQTPAEPEQLVVMHADHGQLSFASFVRYDRPLAKLVWPTVSLIHRRVSLALVRSAIRAQ